jgi:hypothetical protein
MGNSFSSESVRACMQKQQEEAWKHVAPDARERIYLRGAALPMASSSSSSSCSSSVHWDSVTAKSPMSFN